MNCIDICVGRNWNEIILQVNKISQNEGENERGMVENNLE